MCFYKLKNPSKTKWRTLYFCMAIIGLLAVGSSLLVNNYLGSQYNKSLTLNKLLTKRFERLDYLQVLASKINAPGNDIFDSKNVKKEKKRFVLALIEFNNYYSETLQYLHNYLEKFSIQKIIKSYNDIQFKMNEMDKKHTLLRMSIILSSKKIKNIQIKLTETNLKGIITYVNDKFLEISRYEHEELIFKINDSGIGIPTHIISNLFYFFEEADSSTTRKYRGSRPGLSISSKLVSHMDGKK